jgi:hypothetical protein
MAYNRLPQTVLAGVALKQTPPPSLIQPAGIIPVTLDAVVATTTSLGVVQIGSGLAITAAGVLSATGSSGDCCTVNVTLTSRNYTATKDDCYIGVTRDDILSTITITLPKGVLGKMYYIKNQATGNVKVQGSSGQTIDGSSFKTLGAILGFTVIFDGTQWNTI